MQLHWQLVWLQPDLTSSITETSKNPPVCLFRTCLWLGGCSSGQERGCVCGDGHEVQSQLCQNFCCGLFPVVLLVSCGSWQAAGPCPSLPQHTSSLWSLFPTAPSSISISFWALLIFFLEFQSPLSAYRPAALLLLWSVRTNLSLYSFAPHQLKFPVSLKPCPVPAPLGSC